MVGQPFQEWLTITHTSHQLPEGDSLSVDISIPDVIKLSIGTVSLEHQPGSGISGDDVPDVVVLGSLSSVGSRVLESSGGANDQSRDGSSPHCQVPHH